MKLFEHKTVFSYFCEDGFLGLFQGYSNGNISRQKAAINSSELLRLFLPLVRRNFEDSLYFRWPKITSISRNPGLVNTKGLQNGSLSSPVLHLPQCCLTPHELSHSYCIGKAPHLICVVLDGVPLQTPAIDDDLSQQEFDSRPLPRAPSTRI